MYFKSIICLSLIHSCSVGTRERTQQEGGRLKTQRSFLKKINDVQYETLLQLAEGTFKVPRSAQMAQQKCAVRRYQRRKTDFHAASGMLYFQGKQVVTASHARQEVKSTFKGNLGSGTRPTWEQIKRKQAGLSLRSVREVLGESQLYQKHRCVFKNKVLPKPVKSSKVNERWQIDLIDMHGEEVSLDGKLQRYILSIIDTFSRFLLLRPLAKKI